MIRRTLILAATALILVGCATTGPTGDVVQPPFSSMTTYTTTHSVYPDLGTVWGLGDSITVGYIDAWTHGTIYNAGSGGIGFIRGYLNNSAQQIDDYYTYSRSTLAMAAPTTCVLMGGTNDKAALTGGNQSDANIEAAYAAMITRMQGEGVVVIPVTEPWVNSDRNLTVVNQWLVDTYPRTIDIRSSFTTVMADTPDGIHPGAAGYKILADLIHGILGGPD